MEIEKLLEMKGIKVHSYKTLGISHFTCVYNENKSGPFYGYGKGIDAKKNLFSALGECLERREFHIMNPDETNKSSLDLEHEYVHDYGYYSELQLSQHAKYRIWDCLDKQDWTLMSTLDGDSIFLPFEGYRCKRDYFRPTSSGWSIGEGRTSILNSTLEFIERHTLLKSWLYRDFGFDLSNYPLDFSNLNKFEEVGITYKVYSLKNQLNVPCILIYYYIFDGKILNLPTGGCFFSSSASLKINDAYTASVNGGLQKLIWIMRGFKNKSFALNQAGLQRFDALNPHFNSYINSDFSSIRFNASYQDELMSYETHSDLQDLNKKISSIGSTLFFKNETLTTHIKCNLTVSKVVITGFIANSYGFNHELPLYNLPNSKVKELMNEKCMFSHPFG